MKMWDTARVHKYWFWHIHVEFSFWARINLDFISALLSAPLNPPFLHYPLIQTFVLLNNTQIVPRLNTWEEKFSFNRIVLDCRDKASLCPWKFVDRIIRESYSAYEWIYCICGKWALALNQNKLSSVGNKVVSDLQYVAGKAILCLSLLPMWGNVTNRSQWMSFFL